MHCKNYSKVAAAGSIILTCAFTHQILGQQGIRNFKYTWITHAGFNRKEPHWSAKIFSHLQNIKTVICWTFPIPISHMLMSEDVVFERNHTEYFSA